MIKAILACDSVGGISRDGTLPWPHNSEDMKWFKNNTSGHVVVMGSTTWRDDHMPSPMPQRTNVLITRHPDDYPGADEYISGDIAHQVCLVADSYPGLITWVIGGEQVIRQTLDIIDEFYISRIPGSYDCDTFLPLEDIENNFTRVHNEAVPGVTFEIWRANIQKDNR